jgi:hypothetical protein
MIQSGPSNSVQQPPPSLLCRMSVIDTAIAFEEKAYQTYEWLSFQLSAHSDTAILSQLQSLTSTCTDQHRDIQIALLYGILTAPSKKLQVILKFHTYVLCNI